jgi:hypothetical protein
MIHPSLRFQRGYHRVPQTANATPPWASGYDITFSSRNDQHRVMAMRFAELFVS